MSGRKSIPLVFVAGCGVLIAAGVALAQTPLPLPPEIAAPKDLPFPGTIHLAVDATDVTRHIFRVKETVPVQSGSLTLLHWRLSISGVMIMRPSLPSPAERN